MNEQWQNRIVAAIVVVGFLFLVWWAGSRPSIDANNLTDPNYCSDTC